jgi:signal peptidase I
MNTQDRKPLLALAASMLMPGLGQVYNGEATKGISMFLGFAFTVPCFSWLALHGPHALLSLSVFIGVLVAVGVYIFAISDAYRTAKNIGPHYSLAAYNRGFTYLAILFFGYFFVLNQLTQYTRTWLLEAYKVPSASMTPNLLPGDYFFVDKRINFPGAKYAIHRGDAAIFVYPNDRTTVYIKRIIGLPGDQIEIHDTDVMINGKSIRGEEIKDLRSTELNPLLADHVAYTERTDAGSSYIAIWKKDVKHEDQKFTVPNGQVFVLGDNRDGSYDSRKFGSVPLTDVIAKAKQIWFSAGPQTGVRWTRMGTWLDLNL